jgi:hypothetical protein
MLQRFSILGHLSHLEYLFWKNWGSEWSEILHTSYWFKPSSNKTLILKKYFQFCHIIKPQRSPFKKSLIIIADIIFEVSKGRQ